MLNPRNYHAIGTGDPRRVFVIAVARADRSRYSEIEDVPLSYGGSYGSLLQISFFGMIEICAVFKWRYSGLAAVTNPPGIWSAMTSN